MNKMTNFIYKKMLKLSFLFPFFLLNDESIFFILLLIIVIYLHKSSGLFKLFNIKNNKNNNNNKNKNKNKNNKNNNNIDIDFDNVLLKKNDNEFVPLKKNDNEFENENIKFIYKKKNKKTIDNTIEYNPYPTNKIILNKNYSETPEDHEFSVNVNQNICSTPVFSLRTYQNIDFYFNFLIHDYDSKKIHNLIMCKDIHKWMSNSSLSDEDIANELVPIYYSYKESNSENVNVYEYLKIFINSNDDGKIAFIQKGNDFNVIENSINKLIENDIISDLLKGKAYTNYNLSSNDGVTEFLNKFLSLVLISENSIGEQVKFDIKNYYENKSTYEYFFNTINSESLTFTTTL
jgi:hypothetical protein